jgi:hypothetical protein
MANTEENVLASPAGLTRDEQRAIETLYRAFSDKNPDLLDKAVAFDWQDIPLAPGQGPGPGDTWHLEDWFGMLNQVGAWPPAATVANREVAQ